MGSATPPFDLPPQPTRGRTSRVWRRGAPAFTLIELLVVIAIIALLIGLLLPSLRRARLEGWKVVSLSNLRSIGDAGAMYQSDQMGVLPIVPTGVPVPQYSQAFITWGGWGKFTGTFWMAQGGIFDIAPSSRPLNPYLWAGPLPRAADSNQLRGNFQMPGFKDPSDKIGHQQTWDAFQPSFGIANPNADGSSCYNDVGTSYLVQIKWFFQTLAYSGGSDWMAAWRLGVRRIKTGDSFIPSRFIWVNDEYCDITINQVSDTAQIKNGYGDINKSVVGFIDGHARYMSMIPGGEADANRNNRPWLVPAYSNSEYTVVFPDLTR